MSALRDGAKNPGPHDLETRDTGSRKMNGRSAIRALFVGVATTLCLSGGAAWAIHPSNNPTAVGEIGPLIPFHKDAIHAGLAATGDGDLKICFS